MNIKQKVVALIVSFMAIFAFAAAPSPIALAASGTCGGTKTQILSCEGKSGVGAINEIIKIAITVLTVLIGIVATGGIAYAAVLYASARDNQSQVNEAMVILRNIVIGIVLYGFTIVIINWLIPGGVIG